MKLARHENLCCLELWPEVARDDRWVHHGLYIVSIDWAQRPVYSLNFELERADLFASNPSYP
jgi:hypothetical protein